MSLGAVVLCGGESRRMGRAKAWLPFGPELMLQRVVRLIGTVAGPIVVVAAPGQDVPELPPEVSIVRDEISGRGPLQGLAAGFAAFGDSVDLVYATGTDVPFLEPKWITRLSDLIGDADLAIPSIGDYYHPLAALYRPRVVLPAISDCSVRTVCGRHSCRGCQDAGCARDRDANDRPRARDAPESEPSGRIRAGLQDAGLSG